MFIYTLKASTIKLAALSLASVMLIASLIIFLPIQGANNSVVNSVDVSKQENTVKYGKIKNADDMDKFIASLGWTVEKNPTEIVDVQIPSEFNNVYLKYNDIQKRQGLNLEKYKGKAAKRYTYIVTNYPGTTETVYLNLIFFKNRVIAGDVCSEDLSGFVHGIKYEDAENYNEDNESIKTEENNTVKNNESENKIENTATDNVDNNQ